MTLTNEVLLVCRGKSRYSCVTVIVAAIHQSPINIIYRTLSLCQLLILSSLIKLLKLRSVKIIYNSLITRIQSLFHRMFAESWCLQDTFPQLYDVHRACILWIRVQDLQKMSDTLKFYFKLIPGTTGIPDLSIR